MSNYVETVNGTQLHEIQRLEARLFELLEAQIAERIEGKRPNYERLKRIETLQTEYSAWRFRQT